METQVSPSAKELFPTLPESLRDELFRAYAQITRNYLERRWEPSELNGGKLCEVVYTILKGHVDGRFPPSAKKPPNFVDACRSLEKADSALFPRSVRIQVPRMLMALYEIRNNRGVGHVGGDVDPNEMDATCVLYMAKWVLAELIRLFHSVSIESAAAAVEQVVERIVPLVWQVAGKRRVLNTALTMKQKALILLYSQSGRATDEDLTSWSEHSNASAFRRDVLRPLHRDKLVEYDETSGLVHLSPNGAAFVEATILRQTS